MHTSDILTVRSATEQYAHQAARRRTMLLLGELEAMEAARYAREEPEPASLCEEQTSDGARPWRLAGVSVFVAALYGWWLYWLGYF